MPHPRSFRTATATRRGSPCTPRPAAVWVEEHGPRGGDEVNVVVAGANYGWPVITYGRAYSGLSIGEGSEKEGMAQPLHYWVPSISPSGMAFYQGDAFPEWQGDLFVGGLSGQLLARLELDGEQVVGEERLLEGVLGPHPRRPGRPRRLHLPPHRRHRRRSWSASSRLRVETCPTRRAKARHGSMALPWPHRPRSLPPDSTSASACSRCCADMRTSFAPAA